MVDICLTRVQIQFLKSSFNVHSGENGEILRIGFLKLFNKNDEKCNKNSEVNITCLGTYFSIEICQ